MVRIGNAIVGGGEIPGDAIHTVQPPGQILKLATLAAEWAPGLLDRPLAAYYTERRRDHADIVSRISNRTPMTRILTGRGLTRISNGTRIYTDFSRFNGTRISADFSDDQTRIGADSS